MICAAGLRRQVRLHARCTLLCETRGAGGARGAAFCSNAKHCTIFSWCTPLQSNCLFRSFESDHSAVHLKAEGRPLWSRTMTPLSSRACSCQQRGLESVGCASADYARRKQGEELLGRVFVISLPGRLVSSNHCHAAYEIVSLAMGDQTAPAALAHNPARCSCKHWQRVQIWS